MPGFNVVSFQTDSHTNARGRVARLVAALFEFNKPLGIAVD
jgi:cyanophycinase-like exopeptidase